MKTSFSTITNTHVTKLHVVFGSACLPGHIGHISSVRWIDAAGDWRLVQLAVLSSLYISHTPASSTTTCRREPLWLSLSKGTTGAAGWKQTRSSLTPYHPFHLILLTPVIIHLTFLLPRDCHSLYRQIHAGSVWSHWSVSSSPPTCESVESWCICATPQSPQNGLGGGEFLEPGTPWTFTWHLWTWIVDPDSGLPASVCTPTVLVKLRYWSKLSQRYRASVPPIRSNSFLFLFIHALLYK